MISFVRLLNFKVGAVAITVAVFLNGIVYGVEICERGYLRVPVSRRYDRQSEVKQVLSEKIKDGDTVLHNDYGEGVVQGSLMRVINGEKILSYIVRFGKDMSVRTLVVPVSSLKKASGKEIEKFRLEQEKDRSQAKDLIGKAETRQKVASYITHPDSEVRDYAKARLKRIDAAIEAFKKARTEEEIENNLIKYLGVLEVADVKEAVEQSEREIAEKSEAKRRINSLTQRADEVMEKAAENLAKGTYITRPKEILRENKELKEQIEELRKQVEELKKQDSLLEREKIIQALKQNEWQVGKTAKQLGISRPTLYNKMERYKIVMEIVPRVGLKIIKDMIEKAYIIKALDENGCNREKTHNQLDIDRVTLYNKIKKYGIEFEFEISPSIKLLPDKEIERTKIIEVLKKHGGHSEEAAAELGTSVLALPNIMKKYGILEKVRISRGISELIEIFKILPQKFSLRDLLKKIEIAIIKEYLDENKWKMKRTAEQLSINRATLYNKITQHGITEEMEIEELKILPEGWTLLQFVDGLEKAVIVEELEKNNWDIEKTALRLGFEKEVLNDKIVEYGIPTLLDQILNPGAYGMIRSML